jgi:drug/metabolite transporter (DMT)-like permease
LGLRRQYVVPLVSIALVGSVLANITGYYGLEHSSSVNYGFLIKSAVIFTVILAYLFLDEHISHHKLVLLFGLIAGVYLVTTQGKGIVPSRFDLLIIVSAFFYASSNTIAKSVLYDVDPQIVAFFRTCGGVMLLGAALALAGQPIFTVIRYDLVLVTGSLLACMQMVMYRALRITSVSYLSMMSMMTPVIVTVLGIAFLKESFTAVQAVGGMLILVCGVFIYKKNI